MLDELTGGRVGELGESESVGLLLGVDEADNGVLIENVVDKDEGEELDGTVLPDVELTETFVRPLRVRVKLPATTYCGV